MNDKERVRPINWIRFTIFALLMGLIIGGCSVLSDNLSYFGDGETSPFHVYVLSYISVMMNSLPMWFITAMAVGYLFGKKGLDSIFFGAIYTAISITFYFVIGACFAPPAVALSFDEQVWIYTIWLAASLVGGSMGGALGFYAKTSPYPFLLLSGGLFFQLLVNGQRSWHTLIGIAQNLTFLFLMVIGLIYFVRKLRVRNQ